MGMFTPWKLASSAHCGFYFFIFQRAGCSNIFISTPLLEVHTSWTSVCYNQVASLDSYHFLHSLTAFSQSWGLLWIYRASKGWWKRPLQLFSPEDVGTSVTTQGKWHQNVHEAPSVWTQGADPEPLCTAVSSLRAIFPRRVFRSPRGPRLSPSPQVLLSLKASEARGEGKVSLVMPMGAKENQTKQDRSEQEGGNGDSISLATGDEREDWVQDNSVSQSLTLLRTIRITKKNNSCQEHIPGSTAFPFAILRTRRDNDQSVKVLILAWNTSQKKPLLILSGIWMCLSCSFRCTLETNTIL